MGAEREEGTTTENLLKRACAHLVKVDPKLKIVIDQFPCKIFAPEGLAEEVDPFRSLTSGIMAQHGIRVVGYRVRDYATNNGSVWRRGNIDQE